MMRADANDCFLPIATFRDRHRLRPLWVKKRKARSEHILSALHQKAEVALTYQALFSEGVSAGLSIRSNNDGPLFAGVAIRLRLAGVKPNSDAIRIMISACRLTIERYGDWIGNPVGDLIIAPYFSSWTVDSAHNA